MSDFITTEGEEYDLIFSHMCMEHLQDPLSAHSNIWRLLKNVGYSVQLYPSRNNFPLFANSILPERISFQLVRFFQVDRDLTGSTGKFPAYYKLCGPASKRLHSTFGSLGFDVVQHDSYTGHTYYNRVPIVRTVEKKLRRVIVKFNIPIVSFNLLVLKTRVG